MRTLPLIDLKDSYNARLKARWRRRVLARAAVALFEVMGAMGIGALIALVGAAWFTAFGLAVIVAGVLGRRIWRN
jgi:hypothetical protein